MALTQEVLLSNHIIRVLKDTRQVDTANIFEGLEEKGQQSFPEVLNTLGRALLRGGRNREAEALEQVLSICLEENYNGGLGLGATLPLTPQSRLLVEFQVEAWLQALTSEDNGKKLLKPLLIKPLHRQPMTLSQKILAHHAIGKLAARGLEVGNSLSVSVDWVVSSELAWEQLASCMENKNATTIFRNDRLWLAGDHRVDPRNYDTPMSKRLIASTEKAKNKFKLTDYKGSNYTIIHTEFVRERAQPGMLVVGADSHTCSAGAVGCLSIGLGGEDVVIPLITGETWFKTPECIKIQFVGQPPHGIGGKDIILYILGELKRNTVAANRIVEFQGPGLAYLSIDARFALSNMCTEFGAVTGLCVPDEVTHKYIQRRAGKNGRSASLYFKPDEDAEYAETFHIDLSKIKSTIAIYPSPDNAVPVTEQVGKKLDGCFIGACTTTEEDLVLAGLILKAGLAKGLNIAPGKRHVTPGSLPVAKRLEGLGLLEVFEAAGFSRGAPGCSYCVGVTDTALPGTVWLSSQNRNFPNRMGKGSFGNLAAASTVAASSFSMTVTDPTELLSEIDLEVWTKYRSSVNEKRGRRDDSKTEPTLVYMEPNFEQRQEDPGHGKGISNSQKSFKKTSVIKSRVVTLGDFVDTDALSPSEFLLSATTDEALAGLGVQCVIARSFAFIYARNQPNIGLLGIVIDDDSFHKAAQDDVEIEVDIDARKVKVNGESYAFKLDDMEIALVQTGGMTAAYRQFGNELFQKLAAGQNQIGDALEVSMMNDGAERPNEELQW